MKKQEINTGMRIQNTLRQYMHVIFAHISAKEGIKIFGQRAISAMFKKLKQLDEGDMKGKLVVAPIDPFH